MKIVCITTDIKFSFSLLLDCDTVKVLQNVFESFVIGVIFILPFQCLFFTVACKAKSSTRKHKIAYNISRIQVKETTTDK